MRLPTPFQPPTSRFQPPSKAFPTLRPIPFQSVPTPCSNTPHTPQGLEGPARGSGCHGFHPASPMATRVENLIEIDRRTQVTMHERTSKDLNRMMRAITE